MGDYFPRAQSRGVPCEERNGKGGGLNFQQILKGFFTCPIQSPQSQTKFCVTPLVLFQNFCHLRTNGYNAGVRKLVKSIVTVVSGDNF